MYIAQMWVLYQLNASPWVLGLVTALEYGPFLVLPLLSATWIDRHGLRKVVLPCRVAHLAFMVMFAGAYFLGLSNTLTYLLLTFGIGCTKALESPGLQVLSRRQLDDLKQLPSAIALGGLAFNVVRSVGPAIAGALVAAASAGAALLVACLCMVPSLMLIALTQDVPDLAGSRKPRFAEAFALLKSAPLRNAALGLAIASTFLAPLSTMFTAYAVEVLHGGAAIAGSLTAAMGPTAVLASLMALHVTSRFGAVRTVQASLGLAALAVVGLAVAQTDAQALGLVAVLSGIVVIGTLSGQTTMQLAVSEALLPKTVALMTLVSMGGYVLGSLSMAAVASQVGIRGMLWCCAAIVLVFAIQMSRWTGSKIMSPQA